MTSLIKTDLDRIKTILSRLQEGDYKKSYQKEYIYFDSLLKLSLTDINIANIDLLPINKIYSDSNIGIILDPNLESKLSTANIDISVFMKAITDNLGFISQYADIAEYNKAKINLHYDLRNDIIKEELAKREQTLRKIIDTENPKLIELVPAMNPTTDLFDLFDFKPDYDLDMESTEYHSMYLHTLSSYFKRYTQHEQKSYDKNSLIQELKQNKLWHTPVFNNPRDYNLEVEEGKSINDFIPYFISPEQRLIKFLCENQYFQHQLFPKDIDYILSVYRCCVFGNNKDIQLFKDNSKYYDSGPYFSSKDCLDKDFRNKHKLYWTLANNAVGIQLAARRRIIFPFMIISDNLDSSRYETVGFDTNLNLGVIILKVKNDKRYIYHYYYIRILTGTIRFFDIFNNIIHFKSSPSAQPRGQLLESKWAIYKLLWYLSFRKIIPSTKEKKCDIIVYNTNRTIDVMGRGRKNIYLLSIYDKDEIFQMYDKIITSIGNHSLNQSLNALIGEFKTELESYVVLDDYRLFHVEKCNKLFVWEIDQSEEKQWNKLENIPNCRKIYETSDKYGTISCIKSNLYVSMNNKLIGYDKLAHNKEEYSVKLSNSLPDVLVSPHDQYFPIKFYYKAIDYYNIDKYRLLVDIYKRNLNRLYHKIYYNFKSYSIDELNTPLYYDKQSESFGIGDEIDYEENLKQYYNFLKYYNDEEYYKSLIDYMKNADRLFSSEDMLSLANRLQGPRVYLASSPFKLKYLKYKQKYLKLKLYNNNI